MMFCGTGSFKDVHKDACGAGAGDVKTPAKEKKAPNAKEEKKKKPGKKNPYASRGLDKFSTVVAELESRREKILRRVGPVGGDHVMVRFVQSEAKGWVAIAVKLPPEEQQQAADAKKFKPAVPTPMSKPSTPPAEPASRREYVKPAAAAKETAVSVPPPANAAAKKAADERRSWRKSKLRPHHYMPFVAVLMLVSLVVFGRAFAICCASIWWYLVPILSGSNGGEEGQAVRRAMAKIGKDLGRR